MEGGTMRLTKTQHEVLDEAARRTRVTAHAWKQGTRCGGNRRLEAIKSLVEMGLLDDYRSLFSSGLGFGGKSAWNNPPTAYSTEADARITDAGRKALET